MFSFSEKFVINLIWHYQKKTNASQGKKPQQNKQNQNPNPNPKTKAKQNKTKTSGMLQLFNQTLRTSAGWCISFLCWKEIFIQMVGHLSVKNSVCEYCDIKWSLYWLNMFMSIYHWACESNFTWLAKKQRFIDRNIVVYKTLSHNLQCLWRNRKRSKKRHLFLGCVAQTGPAFLNHG